MLPSLRALDWRSFLGRPPLPSPSPQAIETLRGETLLVTGAGGSIGSALSARLCELAPKRLVLLEASESRLYAIEQALLGSSANDAPRGVLGSVTDGSLVDEVFNAYAPGVVFHAAAFKHVPLMEEHPLAAIQNNIFGTATLLKAASAHRAKVVLLSTDKAVEPASVMGATKRVSEHIVLSAGGVVLRLGNVLATRDSVTEVFAGQIERGGPLTVTDPAARRYFLTIEEAVDLLLAAAGKLDPPALVIPEMGPAHYITDLAHFMIQSLSSQTFMSIEFTHPRAGDKEAELLWSASETPVAAAQGGVRRLQSPALGADDLENKLAELRRASENRDLAGALTHLRGLVPDYTPSAAVLALAEPRRPRVQR